MQLFHQVLNLGIVLIRRAHTLYDRGTVAESLVPRSFDTFQLAYAISHGLA